MGPVILYLRIAFMNLDFRYAFKSEVHNDHCIHLDKIYALKHLVYRVKYVRITEGNTR